MFLIDDMGIEAFRAEVERRYTQLTGPSYIVATSVCGLKPLGYEALSH